MLLAVDVGNTKTSVGIFDGDELVFSRFDDTRKETTSEEIQAVFLECVRDYPITVAVISTVVTGLEPVWRRAVKEFLEISPLFCNVQTAMEAGMFEGACDDNTEIGADLVANAIAATHLCSLPAVIVDFGTATTLQYLDSRGVMIGAIIAPGAETSMDALFNTADNIDRLPVEAPPSVIGRNTLHAVQSGIVLGEAARVDGLVRLARNELGYDPYVVATGGLCELISRFSHAIERTDKYFTLKGLNIFGREVSPSER